MVRQYPTLKKCSQPHWLGDAIPCAAAPGNVVILPQENGLVIGFGELSDLCRFVEMRGAGLDQVPPSIERIARIFSNSLLLLDKFERDPLTGLLNRQSFVYRFDDLIEYHRKTPTGKPLTTHRG